MPQSSRRVSDMNLGRLYQKRAIDRENQRNLRKRNKEKVSQLEAEVEVLRQKLRDSERQVTNLTSNVNVANRAIASAIGNLQSIDIYMPSLDEHGGNLQTINSTQSEDTASTLVVDGLSDHGFESEFWLNEGTVSLPFNDVSDLSDFSFSLSAFAAQPPYTTTDDASCQLQTTSQSVVDEFHAARIDANSLRALGSVWSITPRYSQPTCKVDRLLYELIEAHKQICIQNSAYEFSHKNFPSVVSLLNPSLTEHDRPVASTIAQHVAGVVQVHTPPEKFALLYVMCVLMRWQLLPTEDHYNSIPEFARPTLLQTIVPHPPWVGTIGWPAARDQIIRRMDFTQYQTFARIITASFSVNWPYNTNRILDGGMGQDYILSTEFVVHIRNIRNWTVGQELIEAFPFLNGTLNIAKK